MADLDNFFTPVSGILFSPACSGLNNYRTQSRQDHSQLSSEVWRNVK